MYPIYGGNMRKINCLLFFVFYSILIFSKPITVEKAKVVAKNCIFERSNSKNLDFKISNVHLEKNRDHKIYYVVSFEKGGFVIVSANDISVPIIGFSFDSQYAPNNLPPAFDFFIRERAIFQISSAIDNGISQSREIRQEWKRLLNESNFTRSEFDLRTGFLTTIWGQGEYYNEQCPADTNSGDGHVRVGCVAVAMAQVINYYENPWVGSGSHSYNHSTYGEQEADFESTTYNYDNMPDEVTASNIDVATLMYHCGVAVNMDYGVGGSGAWGWGDHAVSNGLEDHFYFDNNAHHIVRSSHLPTWEDRMKNNLDENRPVIYGAEDNQEDVGHAWVLDGYSGHYFHCNWGWYGNHDGYFHIDDFSPGGYDFDSYEHAAVSLYPEIGHLNTTWSPADNPHYIYYDQIIDEGDVLNIESGVNLIFKGRYKITVNGELNITGVYGDSVYIYPENDDIGWGGIYFENTNEARSDTSVINYCKFVKGVAKSNSLWHPDHQKNDLGGSIYCNNSSLIIQNSFFMDNYADQSGGAIAVLDMSSVLIRNCIFKNNKADNQGGVISLEYSNLNVYNSKFLNNESLFTSAGAIWIEESNANIYDSEFKGNVANSQGGAISSRYGNLILKRNDFRYNEAVTGGAILLEYETDTIIDSTNIENNLAENTGGGLFLHETEINISNSSIAYNVANSLDGGGIYIGKSCNINIDSTYINNNHANHYGGALFIEKGDFAEIGPTVTIERSTLYNNSAVDAASSIYLDSSTLNFVSSINWNNSIFSQADIIVNGDYSINAFYSDIQGASGESWFGTDCIDTDPMFWNPPVNFDLKWMGYPMPDLGKSPCIDTGSPDSVNDPDGTRADMGVNYYHQEWTNLAPGNISGYLDNQASPYYVDGDLLVPAGEELTIESGSSIIFKGSYVFEVRGRLIADAGTSPYKINIIAQDTVSGFKGLRFYNTNTNQQDSSRVINTRISYGRVDQSLNYGKGGGIYLSNSGDVHIENCLINKNYSSSKGGGVYTSEDSDIYFRKNVVSDNISSSGGGIFLNYPTNDFIFENNLIENNKAEYGGGIYQNSSPMTYSGSTIRNNYADEMGGGMYFYNIPTVTFDSSNKNNIYNNVARVEGLDFASSVASHITIDVIVDTFSVIASAPYFAYPYNDYTFNIEHGKIEQAEADLFVSTAGSDENDGLTETTPLKTLTFALKRIKAEARTPRTIYLENGTYSTSETGEVFPINTRNNVSIVGEDRRLTIIDGEDMHQLFICYKDSNFIFQSMTMQNGYAVNGGAIYLYGSNPQINDLIIRHNNSDNAGAGIFAYQNSDISLHQVFIHENSTTYNGGGLFASYYSDIDFNLCTISHNLAAHGGGVYLASHGDIVIDSTEINYNSALNGGGYLGEGGALFISDCSILLKRSSLENNEAGYAGGAVYVTNCDELRLENMFISENSSQSRGGAFYCTSDIFELYNSHVLQNSADRGAGFYFNGSEEPQIINTVIADNYTYGYDGGGFYLRYSDIHLINCTVCENSSLDDGGGFFCYNSDPIVINSIFDENEPQSIFLEDSAPNVTYSNIEGGAEQSWFGTGCIDQDPLFANPDYYYDFRLTETSPCIDTGIPDTTGLGIPITDLDGQIRIYSGRIDMGAYEYSGDFINIPTNISVTTSSDSVFIEWDPVTGADSYKVYVSPTPDGSFVEETEGTFSGSSWKAAITDDRRFFYVTAIMESRSVLREKIEKIRKRE